MLSIRGDQIRKPIAFRVQMLCVGADRCVRPERFVYPVVNANSASARCHDFVTANGIAKNNGGFPALQHRI